MARAKPNRRILATTINTAVATAAVTATAVGWIAFGMADTSNAATNRSDSHSSQQAHAAHQDVPAQEPALPVPLHRNHRGDFFGGIFGSSHNGQSSPFNMPVTRSRSSR